jgi:hypothetical protein
VNPLDYVKIGVPAAIAVMLGVWLLVARGELATTQSTLTTTQGKLSTSEADLAIANANLTTVRGALIDANQRTLDARNLGKLADAATQQQITAAQDQNKTLALRVVALEGQANAPRPAGLDACQNADRILTEQIDAGPVK